MSSLLLIETAEIIPEGLFTRNVSQPISVITTVKVKYCVVGDNVNNGQNSFNYFDDNEKNIFNNVGNNGHGIKSVTCKTDLNKICLRW